MKKTLFFLTLFIAGTLHAQEPVMQWSFDTQTSASDTIEGLFNKIPGIKGEGILLDGFTTRVVRKGEAVAPTTSAFTIDSWIALGNYPWNWCPILTTESDETKGYRLMVGPMGQVSMQVAIGEQWVACSSRAETIPLRAWMNVTGVYRENDRLELYVNGELVNTTRIRGRVSYTKSDCILGMTAQEGKPSNIHRTWGTISQFYGLDGILDEVKVYDKALSASDIKGAFAQVTVPESGLQPRHLPIVKSTGEFKAYYTKLKYYPGWDNVWRVGDDPDIVVCFEKTPIKLVFWRGIRYGASWVSENENWMTDQSVEAWGVGKNDTEGCFEHMQDRHCRFSHVRIIENTPGRIVVHWRYAPTSAYQHTWKIDEKTGWECWVDEYYYIYPDGSAIRKVSWTTGSLGNPRQFQETLALLSPGQKFSDLVEKEVTTVSDYEGRLGYQRIVDKVQPKNGYDGYTIQRYNYKSEQKPYICFEPGNKMEIKDAPAATYDRAVGCNHFPVGQARCDGRSTVMSDRPSHATSFPISWPVVHNGPQRTYWCALYGMTDTDMDQLRAFGRSWAYAPQLKVTGGAVTSAGYDRSERCYALQTTQSRPSEIKLALSGTKDSPVINPAFYVKDWNGGAVDVYVNGKKYQNASCGVYSKLDRKDLVVFLFLNKTDNVTVTLRPR